MGPRAVRVSRPRLKKCRHYTLPRLHGKTESRSATRTGVVDADNVSGVTFARDSTLMNSTTTDDDHVLTLAHVPEILPVQVAQNRQKTSGPTEEQVPGTRYKIERDLSR